MNPHDPKPTSDAPVLEATPPSLSELLQSGDREALTAYLKALPTDELRRRMAQLSEEQQQDVIQMLRPEDAADLIDDLPDEQAADVLEDLPPRSAAAIIEELDSDDRADVLGEMEPEELGAILAAMPPEDAEETRQLLSYASNTAGGVMATEFIAYPRDITTDQVLTDLRRNREKYSYYNLQYFYVVDRNGILQGVLRLRDIVLSPVPRPVSEVMITHPTTVNVNVDLHTLQHMFEVHMYSALPVVSDTGRLLGIVFEKDVAEAIRKDANRTILKLVGIFGAEELRSMPVLSRVRGRLTWLFLILMLSFCGATVIHLFEGTLGRYIALAMFLPMVSGLSGCSGNQAVGLSLRELTLGVVHPADVFYVLFKELKVGLINGAALGLALGLISGFLRADHILGLIVGCSLMFGTLLAVCIGGTLPLILKRVGLDPAIGSSPILTTVTDAASFFFVLGLAHTALTMMGH